MRSGNTITVFEHESLRVGQGITQEQLKALQSYYGDKGVPYFSLIHNGIRFNEFVGVIQVGSTVIEVLPKADRPLNDEVARGEWREILISMLRSAGIFDVHAPSSSILKIKSNAILELYFELFLTEVEYLLHRGLTKRYRRTESNLPVLKGSINFAKHIRFNLVHKERFYVKHTTYDVHHEIHQILFKAINLVARMNTNPLLKSKAATLQIWFPEMDDVKVTAAIFNRVAMDRKTEPYRKAWEIAKLLLLNFHPDVSKGKNNVLALMFDMNFLWERFVYVSLKRELPKIDPDYSVVAQSSKSFWKHQNGRRSTIRPDIVIHQSTSRCVVVDTKWKNLKDFRPSDEDLKQMFVYHEYFGARKVALIYPGAFDSVRGKYFDITGNEGDRECSMIGLKVQNQVRTWQKEIGHAVHMWMSS